MTVSPALLAAQRDHFARLDPLLPAAAGASRGDELRAATAAGDEVAGILHRYDHQPGSPDLVWSAATAWHLFPFVGGTGLAGMDALLTAWASRMATEDSGEDSACVVAWPSRDAEAARAFLDHGMTPLTVLAIRESDAGEDVPRTGIRRARGEDFEQVLAITAAATVYTGLTGSRYREDTSALVAPGLRATLDSGSAYVAERDGAIAGVADCQWVHSLAGSPAGELLPPGKWAYVNAVSTVARLRGRGIGRAIMATAHDDFLAAGARGSYLYYNPPNPLAPVFWHRQGYRPLWTYWETRPAAALR
ncbi:GNAT family N-acetyltransferase [Amycolatopsis sp. CA-230715]|uniref:GNAT family N-acetyltransferase n=1 Tax=Amycolatopsis sp. CA-230715 TaxID=2745196 RepID=UPI001C01BF3D|nr:GNAT family N-acetyltransferase [Amycolatopsis sp. CA-230715]QWF85582.1 hypothetical protein HUW46_09037 [Amycolatopsis sp. CA-230715]